MAWPKGRGWGADGVTSDAPARQGPSLGSSEKAQEEEEGPAPPQSSHDDAGVPKHSWPHSCPQAQC